MKQKSKMVLSSTLKKGISILLIILIFVGAFFQFIIFNPIDLIYRRFFGTNASNIGVLSLWNIETFESGTGSKSSHLERAALKYEKKYKGAYILIENMTIEELENRLSCGQLPDLFSFSAPAASIIQNYLTELEEKSNLIKVFLESCRTNNMELLAYPYLMGGYCLISSENRLLQAGASEPYNLLSSAYSLGYEKKLKKSTKNIYSLSFGIKNLNKPINALNEECKIKGISLKISDLSQILESSEITSYEAYAKWVAGDSVMLLGTQRDLQRIKNRKDAGKESDFIVSNLSYYTDLVQYIGVVKSDDKNRQEFSENFAEFLITDEIQQKLYEIGMFQTVLNNNVLYNDEYYHSMEMALKSVSRVDKIFV